jgi:membrane protease YdiL (CAAX protease family)
MTTNEKSAVLIKFYGYLWLLYLSFGILLALITNWFPNLLNTEYEQTALLELAKSNPLQLFVLACIFAPIVEEMMFRTLIKPSHSDLILFICSWPVFLGAGYIPESIHWLLKLSFSGVLLFTTHYILKQLIPENNTILIRQKLSKYVLLVLVITSVIFGLVHISNYVTHFTFNIALFVLVVPQIIAGFMLGIVKQKTQDLRWSMGLHFMNNIVPVIIILFSS